MNPTIKILFSFILATIANQTVAQNPAPSGLMSQPWPIEGNTLLYIVGIVVLLMLVLTLVLWKVSIHLKRYYRGEFQQEETELESKYPWERFFQIKPVKTDKDTMMHHEYDGIYELNNPPPPWFMYLFYGTIVIAVIYIIRFTVAGTGPTQQEEYLAEVKAAEIAHEVFLKKTAYSVDESNVVKSSDVNDLAEGKKIFQTKCNACHGNDGQGGVGPNMTDAYWIHGGDIKDLFRTIKYGVIEKGMQNWQKDLNPIMMQQVASYILTLQGTNPPDGKAPQGEKYIPGGITRKDTTTAQTDSVVKQPQ
jgi:cytochrome c oxidase cbb3-type subunit 3